MSYVLQNAPWFVLLIGALVFFHELGHFLVAKAFNVKVVRFSMGFGPKLVAVQRGETEYTLSLLPLGGYVKMVGEDPAEIGPEDQGRALSQKPLWQRSAIVLAGPAANLLLALVVYLAMFVGPHTFGDTRLGIVTPNEPAYNAGVRPGDRIVEVEGRPIQRWEQLQAAIGSRPNAPLSLVYERAGVRKAATLQTESRGEQDAFNQISQRGKAGVSLQYLRPIVAVVDRNSPAAKAGLADGDLVEKVAGQPIEAWHELRALLQSQPALGKALPLTVARGDAHLELVVAPDQLPASLQEDRFSSANAPGAHGYTGLVAKDVVVAQVEPDSPAARAGLAVGDRILTLIVQNAGAQGAAATVRRPVGVWGIDLAAFGMDAATEVALEVQRGTEVRTLAIHLVAHEEADEFKQVHRSLTLGAQNDPGCLGTYSYEAPVGIVEAGYEAALQVGNDMALIGRGIYKMVRGDIPLKSMGGPIMLFVIAERTAKRGWQSFGRAMAMTSVNLGMLNILPVPVLDGGHLLFYGVEAITRRPPSVRVREAANMVGLGLLLLLMMLVFRNDIGRFFFGVS